MSMYQLGRLKEAGISSSGSSGGGGGGCTHEEEAREGVALGLEVVLEVLLDAIERDLGLLEVLLELGRRRLLERGRIGVALAHQVEP